jgi:hypothetical protein
LVGCLLAGSRHVLEKCLATDVRSDDRAGADVNRSDYVVLFRSRLDRRHHRFYFARLASSQATPQAFQALTLCGYWRLQPPLSARVAGFGFSLILILIRLH